MQIHRMLEIAYLLMSGKALTAGALAQRFEVSKRTIYRDVEALSAAGIPVYMTRGRGGGIALSPGSSLGRAVLTEEEKEDVLASLKALGGVAPGAADGALEKAGRTVRRRGRGLDRGGFFIVERSEGHFGGLFAPQGIDSGPPRGILNLRRRAGGDRAPHG